METSTATSTPAVKAPPKPRVQLVLKAEGQEDTKIQGKYPMPLKGDNFKLNINGAEVEASQTEFKGQKYNYFTVNGVTFWVYGALPRDAKYTIEFPEGYEFHPAKIDRKTVAAQSAASAKKRAAKGKEGNGADGGEAGEDGEGEGEADASANTPADPIVAAAAAAPAAPKGKKAAR